jgi:hypothetical protein
MAEENVLEYTGQIDIKYLKLVSTSGLVIDLDDYLVELNIFEDIFNNYLSGQMMISDSRNIISKLPIKGEEYLILKANTPSLDKEISKTFRVYAVTDRKTVRDNNTQVYTLHFCSFEAIVDVLNPLYKPYEGKISDIVEKIFTEFIESPRTYEFDNNGLKESESSTPLYILNETSNKVKFISPGWTPAKCINWLASKSIPEEGKACDFLFWESTQAFYFGNIEKIFSDTQKYSLIKGTYFYYPPNTNKTSDTLKKMFIAEEFDVIKTSDNLNNYYNGYLANRLITLNLYNKEYKVTDFDYIDRYPEYSHSNKNPQPLFATDTLRNPATHNKFYPVNKNLYTGISENVNERIIDIYSNRVSRLTELNNLCISITVPGRTDLEVGSIIEFVYPETEEQNKSTDSGIDRIYSGIYLITAIRHKINMKKHVMIMELTKDSLENTENAD